MTIEPAPVRRKDKTSSRFTAKEIDALKKPGLHHDGGGLYLQISDRGTKSWVYRYTLVGSPRKLGLGSINDIPLSKARDAAHEARKLVKNLIDPIEQRNEKRTALVSQRLSRKVEKAKAITFQESAEQYIAAHEASWTNIKHASQWRRTLQVYAYGKIGNLPVEKIDTPLVLKVIEPLWQTKTETASRLRGRIESILGWATVRGFRTGDNPARWRGHLQTILAAKERIAKTKHHVSMYYAHLPGFMATLRDRSDLSSRALEFTILTASRTGEVIAATWKEFDLSAWLASQIASTGPHATR